MTTIDKIDSCKMANKVIELHNEGLTVNKIAFKIKMKTELVENILTQNGDKPKRTVLEKEMKKLYEEKNTDSVIAKKLNIMQYVVAHWRAKHNLKIVPNDTMIKSLGYVPKGRNEQLCWYCKNSSSGKKCKWVRTLKEQPQMWEDYEETKILMNKSVNGETVINYETSYAIRKCNRFEVE